MKKALVCQVAIFAIAFSFVLYMGLNMSNFSVSDSVSVSENEAYRFLQFDLNSGQGVIGSYLISPMSENDASSCDILDPNGNLLSAGENSYGPDGTWISFSFTANATGQYFLSIGMTPTVWNHLIEYNYIITWFGLSPIVLIVLVIVIATGLIVGIALYPFRKNGKSVTV